jgi:prevent-host-death family protein
VSEVTVRELRNHGGQVLARVMTGESIVVTRNGTSVAELRPLPRTPFTASTLLDRWRHLPHVDPAGLRADIDSLFTDFGAIGVNAVDHRDA